MHDQKHLSSSNCAPRLLPCGALMVNTRNERSRRQMNNVCRWTLCSHEEQTVTRILSSQLRHGWIDEWRCVCQYGVKSLWTNWSGEHTQSRDNQTRSRACVEFLCCAVRTGVVTTRSASHAERQTLTSRSHREREQNFRSCKTVYEP